MQFLKSFFPTKYDGESDHPPLSRKELWGWWWYDWSNSAVSSVIISGFLPLLVQDAAQTAAGFPNICQNIVRNSTYLQEAFGATTEYTTGYLLPETNPDYFPSSSCIVPAPAGTFGIGSICPGLPSNADDCRSFDSSTVIPLRVISAGGTSWDPAAYTNAMNSLSTGLQMFVFISLAALADFGNYRKKVFMGLSIAGCLWSILCLTIPPTSWEWGGTLVVFTSVCYASTYVFYNAWLPLLAANDPLVLAAPKEKQDEVFMKQMHDHSSRGYAFGYLGSVVCLFICIGVTVVLSDDSKVAYSVNCAIAGIWWFGFSLLTFRWLRPRPGPPLPAGENYLVYPWKRMAVTVSRVRQLPQTFFFLLCWFIFSDGFNVISSVGAVYANTSVTWNGVPKSVGLAGLLVITPIFAGIGNMFWNSVHSRGYMSPKNIMRVNLILMALVPIYGLLGFINPALGYRRFWELYIGVIVYGFMLGSVQSFSRSAFGAMIPEGLEAQFYSLYNVTDRGSSWIGPAVVAAVINNTGTVRLAFAYPVVMLLIPVVLLHFVNFETAEASAKEYAKLHGTAVLATRGALTVALGIGGGGSSSDDTVTKNLSPSGAAGSGAATSAVITPASEAEGVALVSTQKPVDARSMA